MTGCRSIPGSEGAEREWFGRPLPAAFFARDSVRVARAALGRLLVYDGPEGRVAGRVVETEAYRGAADPASHAFRGKTRRNQTMFGPPGHAYVYLIYGLHHCLNLVTGREGVPLAVLVRALEPLAGIELMRAHRGPVPPERLASGPGSLAKAFGLTLDHDGIDLTRGPLWLSDLPPERAGRRVGVSAWGRGSASGSGSTSRGGSCSAGTPASPGRSRAGPRSHPGSGAATAPGRARGLAPWAFADKNPVDTLRTRS